MIYLPIQHILHSYVTNFRRLKKKMVKPPKSTGPFDLSNDFLADRCNVPAPKCRKTRAHRTLVAGYPLQSNHGGNPGGIPIQQGQQPEQLITRGVQCSPHPWEHLIESAVPAIAYPTGQRFYSCICMYIYIHYIHTHTHIYMCVYMYIYISLSLSINRLSSTRLVYFSIWCG